MEWRTIRYMQAGMEVWVGQRFFWICLRHRRPQSFFTFLCIFYNYIFYLNQLGNCCGFLLRFFSLQKTSILPLPHPPNIKWCATNPRLRLYQYQVGRGKGKNNFRTWVEIDAYTLTHYTVCTIPWRLFLFCFVTPVGTTLKEDYNEATKMAFFGIMLVESFTL